MFHANETIVSRLKKGAESSAKNGANAERDTAITDAVPAHLSKLSGITGVNLSGTKVTEAKPAHRNTMSRLPKLNVSRTVLTEKGIAEAKKFPFWGEDSAMRGGRGGGFMTSSSIIRDLWSIMRRSRVELVGPAR